MSEPESMFDKLGDLLSSALDSGFIFKEEPKNQIQKPEETAIPASTQTETSQKEEKTAKLPAFVEEAFKNCGIDLTTDFSEARQAYHEKLKYYHPDRRNDNPVLQKVAREKTTALLNNWKIIEDYFKNPYQEPSEPQ